MTTMHLIFNHLNPALEDARTLPADKLPKLAADLEEIRCTLLARLSAPALAQVEDKLLSCSEAAALLHCSRDTLTGGTSLSSASWAGKNCTAAPVSRSFSGNKSKP